MGWMGVGEEEASWTMTRRKEALRLMLDWKLTVVKMEEVEERAAVVVVRQQWMNQQACLGSGDASGCGGQTATLEETTAVSSSRWYDNSAC